MSQELCPQVLVRVTTPSFPAELPAWEPNPELWPGTPTATERVLLGALVFYFSSHWMTRALS